MFRVSIVTYSVVGSLRDRDGNSVCTRDREREGGSTAETESAVEKFDYKERIIIHEAKEKK